MQALKSFGKSLGLIAFASVLAFSNFAHADGSFVGVGIVIQAENKSIQVTDIYQNSPAAVAGILPGDWILAVDGKSTAKQKLSKVAGWLKGDLGTNVTVNVKTGDASARDITLTRAIITYTCYIEGNVYLNLSGSALFGSIDGTTVSWNITGNYVSGYYKNDYVRNLRFENDLSGNIRLSGWIHNSFVDWRGYSSSISVYQSCIQ